MRRRQLLCSLLLIGAWYGTASQEMFYTRTGKISFLSNAPLEDIEAVTKTAGAVLNIKTGTVQAVVLMKGFEFRKALMQEHFNENYVESHKYPRAELKASIINNKDINYLKEGTYTATLKGQLTIHGVTKEISPPITIKVHREKIEVTSVFPLLLSDYRIAIPAIVKDKISNNVKVTADLKLEPLKQ